MTTLNEEDQENLNYILKKDTKKIMKSFAHLSNRTCDSLIRQGVTVKKLVRVAITSNSSLYDTVFMLIERMIQLPQENSIPGIFCILLERKRLSAIIFYESN